MRRADSSFVTEPVDTSVRDVRFFEGGRAIFTVANPVGEHYTYKIDHPSKDKPYFVSLLTGPDNVEGYTYLGLYNPDRRQIVLTAKSRHGEDSKPVRVLRWAIRKVASGERLPEGYAICHEGRCCVCGRMLTTPTSIDRGIGPECERRMS